MSRLQELLDEERLRDFGLLRLEDHEFQALMTWLAEHEMIRERHRLRFAEILAVPPSGRVIELDDGTTAEVQEPEFRHILNARLGDIVMLGGGKLETFEPSLQPALRVIMRRLRGVAGDPDPTAAEEARMISSRLREAIDAGVAQMNRQHIAGRSFILQWHFAGPGGGDYYWEVTDGIPSAHDGCAEDPTMIAELRGSDFLESIDGRITFEELFTAGRWRLVGKADLMLEWNDLFPSSTVAPDIER